MASNGKRIEVPIIAVTDERALRESDQRLKKLGDQSSRSLADKIANAGSDGGKMMAQNFERSFKITPTPFAQINTHADRTARTAGAKLRQGLREGVEDGLADATAVFGRFSGDVNSVLQGVVGKAGTAGIAITGIGVAAGVAGKKLYDLGTMWDDVTDGIATRTGKLGAELDGITASVERVAVGVAVPLKTVGEIAGGVAQSLHLSGKPLDAMTKQISELTEVTGQVPDIRNLGKLFRVFGVDAAQMPTVLDGLYAASTNSGRAVDDLVSTALKAGPALRSFGVDIGASTGLLSLFEDAGVDADTAVGAMTIALKKFADAGLEPQQALRDTITQIKTLSDTGNQVGAIDLAQTTFGKGFAPIFESIRSGNLDAQALSNTLTNDTKPSIGDMADATRDAVEAFEMLKNKVAIEFAPAAKSEFEAINRELTEMIGTLSAIADGDWGSVFGGIWDDLTGPFTSPNAPWRKWFPNQTPPAITDPTTGLPAAQANAPASSRDSGGVPDFTIDPKTGLPRGQSTAPSGTRDSGGLPPGMIQPAPGSPGGPPLLLPTDKGGGSSGQTGPVVPFAGDPMSLLQGFPVTASLYSSANSLLEAQNKVQQQTAELNALLKDNTSTADQIQKARNELADAERQAFQSELSLNEAKKAATEKSLKGMSEASAGFAEIGAGLDADLGFSKGLPGLADNLVRFLGALATAPLQGILSRITQGGNSSQGGMSQGYASGMPPYGGGNVDAMMALAQSSSGKVRYGPASDLLNGLADCSGSISDLVEVLNTGQSSPARLFDTTAFATDAGAAKLGFLPGNMPGALNVGVNPYPGQSGHMAATLPNGVNFEGGGGTGGGAQYGGSAAGALDPQFEKRYYRPVTPFAPQPGSAFGNLSAPAPMTSAELNANPSLTNPALTGLPAPGSVPTGGPLSSGFPNAFSASYAPTTPSEQAAPSWSPQGGGQLGSGFLGMAMGLASGAAGAGANLFAPGSGAVAQAAADMAQKAIQRTIAFGGQVAGIGMQGLQETFGVSDPDGGGNSASASWLTRIAGGLAGARPASVGAAGKQDKGSKVDPNDPANQQPQGQQQGGPQQTNNISIAIPPDRAGSAQKLANDLGGAMYNAYINPGG